MLQVCIYPKNVNVNDIVDLPAGVVAAADDPPEATIEPHLEMSYNLKMPGELCRHQLNVKRFSSLQAKSYFTVTLPHPVTEAKRQYAI